MDPARYSQAVPEVEEVNVSVCTFELVKLNEVLPTNHFNEAQCMPRIPKKTLREQNKCSLSLLENHNQGPNGSLPRPKSSQDQPLTKESKAIICSVNGETHKYCKNLTLNNEI